ncbi:MAG TPA: DedA family protein [Oscillatoriaceae cyanobacterium M33_DOE_052]|uniref:DedA family protein n=1 Tax=Planktothricoides sp. SpSt-374 TaxID=2282167 RepID=A0A7C3VSQ2_9CYAN|nr:DedA family protein [Oscillatoriaceae cyanobacterium M33_DOE_052]
MFSDANSLLQLLTDLPAVIKTFGLVGVWAIVFVETGLFFGVFLPGNSMLFTAGVFASQGLFHIGWLTLGVFVCAVLGNNLGYYTGYRYGRKLFSKEDSWLFHKKHLINAHNFYARHGKETILMARFLPIIRTMGCIVAGMAAMNYRVFLVYNVMGAVVWGFGMPLLGYTLGNLIGEDIDKYLVPIILLIITCSCTTSLFHLYREHKANQNQNKY